MNGLQTALPPLGVLVLLATCCGGSAANPPGTLSCAMAPIPSHQPPLIFTDDFSVDTGFAPYKSIGDTYGEPSCPDQLLVDVDMTSPALANKSFLVLGQWSYGLTVQVGICSELNATTIVFGRPAGGAFRVWDEVSRNGIADLATQSCNATGTDSNPAARGGLVPAGMFAELRIATRATQNGKQVPVEIVGNVP